MTFLGSYPSSRLRRMRQTPWLRRLAGECSFSTSDLIWPLFIIDRPEGCEPIEAMPGVSRLSEKKLLEAAQQAIDHNIAILALFPCLPPARRDENGSEAVSDNGLMPRAIRLLKSHFPQLGLMCDVALDPFTRHGHDGLMNEETGHIYNDETVSVLCEQALVQARAGCDIIAPSDMMDGRIGKIRAYLDKHGFEHVCLAAYAVKYASHLYNPFRQALFAEELLKGDKKTYQMSYDRKSEPLREAYFDIQEGADMLIIKPSLFYFDIIWRIKESFGLPTITYQVSGEYAMMARAFDEGILNKSAILEEYMTSVKRAGADAVMTYFAPEIAKLASRANLS